MTCRYAMRGLAGLGITGVLALIPLISAAAGCGGGSASFFESFGTPYRNTETGGTGGTGPGNTGTGSGGLGGAGAVIDPCDETQLRKFLRISMRNASEDYIHYFLVLVAFVQSDTFPDGTVCPEDIPLYTAFGYVEIPEGQQQEFGSYCFPGPALVYFHRSGQFRTAGGASQLGSAIAPAQGSQATYDTFFNSAGATVPVPTAIIFHNPGTGEGAALKVSRNVSNPCGQIVGGGTSGPSLCQQDAFYYVDEQDRLVGSTALGTGSGRRVPSEIQGTACECLGFDNGVQQLAPSNRTAASARCNEFLRGGRIDYVFVRVDTEPPFPQLVWRVTDAAGGIAHNFDSRAQVP